MGAGIEAPDQPVALFVWGDLPLGGAERRFFRLFHYLQINGHNVYLYTSEGGAAACRTLNPGLNSERVRVFRQFRESRFRLLRYLSVIRLTFRLVRQLRADSISHLHFGENPGPLSFLYALVSKWVSPFSMSLVDSIKDYQRSRRERLFTTVTAKYSSRIDCLSHQIKSDLCLFLGERYREKCLVAPCSFTEHRQIASEPARDIDISFIGRMIPTKGHLLLRNALLGLEGAGRTGLVVHICGSGPLEERIRREFAEVKHQCVQIHFEDDPFQILLRTKVYVTLQEVENYPSQSLLEAMTCGCAIVATDVGLTRKLLDESCAIMIPQDPAALREALLRLLDDEPLRKELGRNARSIVTSRHTVANFAEYFAKDVFGMGSQLLKGGAATQA